MRNKWLRFGLHMLPVQPSKSAREVFHHRFPAVTHADGIRKRVFELRKELRGSGLRSFGQQIVFESGEDLGVLSGNTFPVAAQANVYMVCRGIFQQHSGGHGLLSRQFHHQ